ncbi:MAG: dual specificity protein phosphatase family protein [Anaerolineales bacterium]|nr:dual specificity protein phosphatase family protein [Anaerolineales bacterium]
MGISAITNQIYIAAHPKSADVETIKELGVRLVINMIFHPPASGFSQPPLRLLTLRTFDSPWLPIPVKKLEKGVMEALPVIAEGGAVLIYCREGRHRSVAMASAILIGLGSSADAAMQLIAERREAADPYAPHIQRQIRKFEQRWKVENH